jgi:hypothetical protein
LSVTPNHPDLVWTFAYDDDHQDDRDDRVMFEFHPEDEEFANSLGYQYGALQYLFCIPPDNVHEIMENCILFPWWQSRDRIHVGFVGIQKDLIYQNILKNREIRIEIETYNLSQLLNSIINLSFYVS